jgi:serine/threonine-protein kinase
VAAKIEAGGTRNPAAFDAYLRAMKAYWESQSAREEQAAIALYTESIRLDPHYALAFANRSLAFTYFARNWAEGSGVHAYRGKAQADAHMAIALAPDLAEGHLALAVLLGDSLEFKRASDEFANALALGPNNAGALRAYSEFAASIGRTDAALKAVRRSVDLDPLNPWTHYGVGFVQFFARSYDEAIAAYIDAKALAPNDMFINTWLGYAYYWKGDLQSAQTACESVTDEYNKDICLALVYRKRGLRADADSMLATVRNSRRQDLASWLAIIYAAWGDTARALDSLERAAHQRDSGLNTLKTDPGFDSLRKEPRFQAVMRELKFPD